MRASVLVVVLAAVLSGCAAWDESSEKVDAEIACEKVVGARLGEKPRFSDQSAVETDGIWKVTGQLEGSDTTGSYACELEATGGGKYRVKSVDVPS